jgi:hypothetical protein
VARPTSLFPPTLIKNRPCRWPADPTPYHHAQTSQAAHCYLPLDRVMGDVLLRAQLRTRDKGGADGRVPALGGSSRRSAGAALGPGSSCGVTVVLRGGNHGLVRDAAGGLRLRRIGEELAAALKTDTGAGHGPGCGLASAARRACGSLPSSSIRRRRAGGGRGGWWVKRR